MQLKIPKYLKICNLLLIAEIVIGFFIGLAPSMRLFSTVNLLVAFSLLFWLNIIFIYRKCICWLSSDDSKTSQYLPVVEITKIMIPFAIAYFFTVALLLI